MVRTDVSLTVRQVMRVICFRILFCCLILSLYQTSKSFYPVSFQAALHVWKTIVANTPKTLKEIMPVLMNTLIASLASSSSERRQVAARALGELVRKLGERVLPLIIPILSQGLKDSDTSRRQVRKLFCFSCF